MASKFTDLQISVELFRALETKLIPTDSPMAIIVKCMEIIKKHWSADAPFNKKEILIKVLERIGAGKDSVFGTNDDLIPAATLEEIKRIIDGPFLDSVINTALDISKGKFDLAATQKAACGIIEIAKHFICKK